MYQCCHHIALAFLWFGVLVLPSRPNSYSGIWTHNPLMWSDALLLSYVRLFCYFTGVLIRQKVWGHVWHHSIAFTECCICCLSPELFCSLNLIILHITYRVSNTEVFRLSSAISDWLLTVTACTVLFSFPCGWSALNQFPLRVSWAGLQYQFFHFLLLRWWLLQANIPVKQTDSKNDLNLSVWHIIIYV